MTDDQPRTDDWHGRHGSGGSPTTGRTRYQELRGEGVLYRKLVETIQDTIVVADGDRTVVDCNRALTDRFGYGLDDVAGQRTDVLYADRAEFDAVAWGLLAHADDPTVTRVITYETATGDSFPGESSPGGRPHPSDGPRARRDHSPASPG